MALTQSYFFAQFVLPEVAFADEGGQPQGALELVEAFTGGAGPDLLAALWERAGARCPPDGRQEPHDLAGTVHRVGDWVVVCVEMPPPTQMGDACLVAVAARGTWTPGRSGPTKLERVSFLLLEVGVRIRKGGGLRFVLCERDARGGHLVIGDGPPADVPTFVHAVVTQLANEARLPVPPAPVGKLRLPGWYWLEVGHGRDAFVAYVDAETDEAMLRAWDDFPILVLTEFPAAVEALAYVAGKPGAIESYRQVSGSIARNQEGLAKTTDYPRRAVQLARVLAREASGSLRANLERALEVILDARAKAPPDSLPTARALALEAEIRRRLAELARDPIPGLKDAWDLVERALAHPAARTEERPAVEAERETIRQGLARAPTTPPDEDEPSEPSADRSTAEVPLPPVRDPDVPPPDATPAPPAPPPIATDLSDAPAPRVARQPSQPIPLPETATSDALDPPTEEIPHARSATEPPAIATSHAPTAAPPVAAISAPEHRLPRARSAVPAVPVVPAVPANPVPPAAPYAPAPETVASAPSKQPPTAPPPPLPAVVRPPTAPPPAPSEPREPAGGEAPSGQPESEGADTPRIDAPAPPGAPPQIGVTASEAPAPAIAETAWAALFLDEGEMKGFVRKEDRRLDPVTGDLGFATHGGLRGGRVVWVGHETWPMWRAVDARWLFATEADARQYFSTITEPLPAQAAGAPIGDEHRVHGGPADGGICSVHLVRVGRLVARFEAREGPRAVRAGQRLQVGFPRPYAERMMRRARRVLHPTATIPPPAARSAMPAEEATSVPAEYWLTVVDGRAAADAWVRSGPDGDPKLLAEYPALALPELPSALEARARAGEPVDGPRIARSAWYLRHAQAHTRARDREAWLRMTRILAGTLCDELDGNRAINAERALGLVLETRRLAIPGTREHGASLAAEAGCRSALAENGIHARANRIEALRLLDAALELDPTGPDAPRYRTAADALRKRL